MIDTFFIAWLIAPALPLWLAGLADRRGGHWARLPGIVIGVASLIEVVVGTLLIAGVPLLEESIAGQVHLLGLTLQLAGIGALPLLYSPATNWLKRLLLNGQAPVGHIERMGMFYLQQVIVIIILGAWLNAIVLGIPRTMPTFQALTSTIALYLLVSVILLTARGQGLREIRLRLGLRPLVAHDWKLILGSLISVMAIAIGGELMLRLLNPAGSPAREYTDAITVATGGGLVLLAVAVGAALAEELFYRGALQPRLGWIKTSLLFGLMHTGYGLSGTLVIIIGLGFVFGLVRRNSGSVLPAMIVHAAYNGLVFMTVIFN